MQTHEVGTGSTRSMLITELPILGRRGRSASRKRLRDFEAGLIRFGVTELDLGIVAGNDRRVTRFLAQFLYEEVDARGVARWSGIRYLSRLGEGWECWAIL